MAPRLLLVKADGSVSVHADDRAYKPLNWMSPPCWLEEQPGVWTVRNKAEESLVITIDEVLHDTSHERGVDPGLVKDGVEQLTRYLDLLGRDPLLTPVTGVFAAQQIKPQARTLAVDRGIRCVVVDYDGLRGRQSNDLRLF